MKPINGRLLIKGFVVLLAAERQADGTGVERDKGRGWTVRLTGAVRYRRYSDFDGGGRPSILFKFEPVPGQSDLPEEVYAVLHSVKHLDRPAGQGKGKMHTHPLEFTRDSKHGRVWRLNDDGAGRYAADILDQRLSELAHRLENEQSRDR